MSRTHIHKYQTRYHAQATYSKAIRARGISIILVEHLMRAVVALSDRLIVLRQGQVIAEGEDARKVLGRPEVVEAYFGKAASVARA